MAKFTIIKGRDFEATFVIKATGSTTAVELVDGDTGTFTLSSVGFDACVLLDQLPMTITDGPNGEMSISLTAAQTDILPYDVEFGEDAFPAVATCSAVLDINTQAEGKIFAQVPKVYVQNVGEACPA